MKYVIAIIIGMLFQQEFILKSPVFAHQYYIPMKYTCEGMNINPPFIFEGIPESAKSLTLIMEDTESPNGDFVHWVMWNIPVGSSIAEKSIPGVQGRNSMKENKYYGPCPPNGIHKYNFIAYALDIKLNLPDSSGKISLLSAIQGHIIASAKLTGLYKQSGIGK